MTARETLGLRPGERTTLDAVKAALRLAKPMVGVVVMPDGIVRAVELGDRYFDNVWHPTTDAEPILELTPADVVAFYRWCCDLTGTSVTPSLWERLRVDFQDIPRRDR